MFGLMRAKRCGMTAEEKHFRRLNYCGTCKTIGSLYGQKSRLLLNHDAVFLAELLTALSGEEIESWNRSYQSFNCLNLPAGEMPQSLQFAAATNVILTEFKLADHAADEKKKRYNLAQRVFSADFQKAQDRLQSWNFPLAEVRAILETQEAREREDKRNDAAEMLADLAAPTARVTALFFREGVKFIGVSEEQSTADAIGHSFGELIYLLDAFEDYEKDFDKKQFNAIRAVFELTRREMPAEIRRKVISLLLNLKDKCAAHLRMLPLGEAQKRIFISRISANLERKLKTELPVIKTGAACTPRPKQTFKKRWQNASAKARLLAKNYSWQMPLVFLFIFIFTLAAPAQMREARSARECFDLSFNLMFLGAVFSSVMAAVPSLKMQQTAGEKLAEEAKNKKREGWCENCDCDCCDCCDCGDGCDCCCNCDGCCCDGGCCDCSCD